MPNVTYDVHGDVALIQINNPPVNALSPGVPEGLMAAVDRAEHDVEVRSVVIIGAGRTFVSGADISALEEAAWGKLGAAPDLHPLLTRIEDSRKPVVMAIHGNALGGGLELAMAGHYRIATSTAVVGQPEVSLGVIPGAEGTQRLPRLVGVEKALDMCVTGKPLRAADARAAGLLNMVIDRDLPSGALAFARDVGSRDVPVKTRDRADRLGSPEANAPLFEAARRLAGKIRKRQIAPLKAIEAIEAATTLSYADGCARERQFFFECVQTEQAKALIHAFFAERAAAKVKGIPADVQVRTIERVAIIGAGTMGGGIAMACANAGIPVALTDMSQDALDRGLATIKRNYDASVKRGRLTEELAAERVDRIGVSLDRVELARANLVIEAVFESMATKKQVFGEIDAFAAQGTVLATNTSTLDIDEIASATSRPQDVVGLHFFSPANVMRLVEIIRGAATSPEVIATSVSFAKRLGKVPVVVGNCRGFVGNRMMFPYMYEAQFLVEEGATPEQVDRALTDFGMAMGIFAVDDMAGLDVGYRVRQELGHFTEAGVRRPLVADELYRMGRLGQKSGRGWYVYDENRQPTPDPDVTALIRSKALEAGIAQRAFTDEEIVERCIYALVNEGARILEEGAAQRASDIDVVYLNGTDSPRGVEDRCSLPTAPGSRPFTIGSSRSIANSAIDGHQRHCSRHWRAQGGHSAIGIGMPDIIPSETMLEQGRDGVIYARSPVTLGPYPDAITDRLVYWAEHAPARTFLARRDSSGRWQRLSYADAFTRVRSVAQALLDRRLSADRPVVILSGNSLEHAVLALAALHAGVLYAPLAPAYTLLAREYTTLRTLWQALTPGLVFADRGEHFERALAQVAESTEIVTCTPPATLGATPFAELESTVATTAVDEAHRNVGPETIAKVLYTSGSTGRPKGVINTQRMLCANQEMVRTVMPLLAEAPVLCDWLPWNHTFGGNHNFGIVLYNGGTLYIDDGKPMAGAFDTTVANLREVPVTAYFNVPKGFEMLVPRLRSDEGLRTHFFANVRMLFCAAASIRQQVADDVLAMAATAGPRRVPLVTGIGATETAPFALCAGDSEFGGGRVGVPAPGVELKLAPVGSLYEARIKGPAVTPGYWRDPDQTKASFDDEGFYRMGDALAFHDAADPSKGFIFQGRLSEDFKLSTGTWVRVGPLREQLLAHFGELVQNIVIAGDARDEVTALVFPSVDACRGLCGPGARALTTRAILERPEVRTAFAARLSSFCARNTSGSTAIPRMILLDEPASIDAQELTDKGSVNQKQVLANRAPMVEQLYGADGSGILIAVSTPIETLD